MSPTILAELLAIRNSSRADAQQRAYHAWLFPRDWTGRAGKDPSRILVAEMPERRYHESMAEEDARIAAHGGKEKCPSCGEYAVEHFVTTGFDPTTIYDCTNCDWKAM